MIDPLSSLNCSPHYQVFISDGVCDFNGRLSVKSASFQNSRKRNFVSQPTWSSWNFTFALRWTFSVIIHKRYKVQMPAARLTASRTNPSCHLRHNIATLNSRACRWPKAPQHGPVRGFLGPHALRLLLQGLRIIHLEHFMTAAERIGAMRFFLRSILQPPILSAAGLVLLAQFDRDGLLGVSYSSRVAVSVPYPYSPGLLT